MVSGIFFSYALAGTETFMMTIVYPFNDVYKPSHPSALQ